MRDVAAKAACLLWAALAFGGSIEPAKAAPPSGSQPVIIDTDIGDDIDDAFALAVALQDPRLT